MRSSSLARSGAVLCWPPSISIASFCGAIEIQHEACDGVLLAKAEAVELFTTEAVPQALLGVGHVLAQVARSLQERRWDWGGRPGVLFPPPSLPPLGGGVGGRAF